jgi:hypothetical protein
MTLAKVPGESEIGGFPRQNGLLPDARQPAGATKIPAPEDRNGDWKLLLLDLNQQPFD